MILGFGLGGSQGGGWGGGPALPQAPNQAHTLALSKVIYLDLIYIYIRACRFNHNAQTCTPFLQRRSARRA